MSISIKTHRKVFAAADMSKSLKELNLAPSAALVLTATAVNP
jgi:hypothetical protein